MKDLTEESALSRLNKLTSEIEKHNRLYHQEDNPEITDAEYDALVLQTKDLLSNYPNLVKTKSVLNEIGFKPSNLFKKVKHSLPLYSLANIFNEKSFFEWMESRRDKLDIPAWDSIPLSVELKIDGLSLGIRYENRVLVQALTRGDGKTGEDVTQNALRVCGIPKNLPSNAPDILEVRGEVFISKEDFEIVRKDLESDIKIVNPRNVAAGSIRQKDPNKVSDRKLSFIPHGIGEVSEPIAETWSDTLDFIKGCGIGIDIQTTWSINDTDMKVLDLFNDIQSKRASLPIEIDGVVYKLDNFKQRELLGFTESSPRWAVAHKLPADKAVTTINDIEVQVGRTGKITPVARLNPVVVGGVVVSNVTLHNQNHIRSLDLRIGDKVEIQRAGDVIPQIVRYVSEPDFHSSLSVYSIPDNCPSCEGVVFQKDGEADTYCTSGLRCDAQIVERLIHVVSRDALNVDGLGEEVIKLLITKCFISEPADIFNLHKRKEELISLEGFGEVSVNKILSAIEYSRKTTLDRALYAVGIKLVGRTVSRLLSDKFSSLDNVLNKVKNISDLRKDIIKNSTTSDSYKETTKFINRTKKTLLKELAIPGIGYGILQNLLTFIEDEVSLSIAIRLWDELEIQSKEPIRAESLISGKTVVFTGSLNISREEAKLKAESLGAKVVNTISSKTDYLVLGEGGGSKRKTAENIGTVKILNEKEWNELIKG